MLRKFCKGKVNVKEIVPLITILRSKCTIKTKYTTVIQKSSFLVLLYNYILMCKCVRHFNSDHFYWKALGIMIFFG